MTTREVLEQALEVLQRQQSLIAMMLDSMPGKTFSVIGSIGLDDWDKAIAAIKEERAKPAPEPVGMAGTMPGTDGFTMACFYAASVPVGTELYLSPPPPKVLAPEPTWWEYSWDFEGDIHTSLSTTAPKTEDYAECVSVIPLYREPPPPKVPEGWQLVQHWDEERFVKLADELRADINKTRHICKTMLAAAKQPD